MRAQISELVTKLKIQDDSLADQLWRCSYPICFPAKQDNIMEAYNFASIVAWTKSLLALLSHLDINVKYSQLNQKITFCIQHKPKHIN